MRISDWSSDVCSSDLLYYTLRERSGVGASLFRRPWDGGSPVSIGLPGLQTLYPLGAQEGVSGLLVGGAGWTRFPTVMRVDARGAASETRSDERRVGTECVSTCISRCSPDH